MMNFEYAQNAFTATNSIKPVTIRELDMYFVLDMPQGDLYNDYENISELFDTFEEAKRWAETYVGIKMNMKDL